MKIRAIRLREVGIFRSPVALEGFSGGLDVLAGPNELGKSTILRALDAALFVPHTSRTSSLEILRPFSGGAPLIEVDFEAGDRLWRLRKHFLSGSSADNARLIDAGRGTVVARGADAHAQVLDLIGAGPKSPGRIGLLWAEQGHALKPQAVDKGADVLRSAIEREVAEVTSSAARAVHAGVLERLHEFVTKGRRQPTAKYQKALQDRDGLAAELNAARERARAAEERVARVERLRAERQELDDPGARQERAERQAELQRQIDSGQEAREQLRLARAEQQSHEQTFLRFDERHKRLRTALSQLAQLAADTVALTSAEALARQALTAAEVALADASANRDAARHRLQDMRALDKAREAEDRRLALSAQHTDAARRLGEAEDVVTSGRALAEQLAAIVVTPDLLEKLENEFREIDEIEARLAASAPVISMSYMAEARARVSIDGGALDDGADVRLDGPVRLDIPGIGRLEIRPGHSDDAVEDAADLAAHRAEFEASLAGSGMRTVDDIRAALRRKQSLASQIDEARTRVRVLAPEGLETLKGVVDRLAADLAAAGAGGEALPSRAEIDARRDQAERDFQACDARFDEAERGVSKCQIALSGHASRLEHISRRIAELNEELPESGERAHALETLEAQAAEAAGRRDEAIRRQSAWTAKAPDDAAWQVLQSRMAQLRDEEQQRRAKRAAIAEEIARLEGELTSDRENEVARRRDELEDELATAERRVEAMTAEVEALKLLDTLLSQAEKSSRDTFLAPVAQRIAPYLSMVLTDAELRIGEGFAVNELVRAGEAHPIERLSDGTQEQIAVITRLAFGRLMADQGTPAPVILDDALVYSDDDRIERLFAALRVASEHHQVIILTCRMRTFAALGGNPLTLAPWTVD